MNKKDFSIGLVAGFILSMCFSFFIINYYIEKKVDEAKVNAEKQYETLKNKLETEFKEEVASIKAYTSKKAAEKGTVLMESASNELKKYWKKGDEVLDSLSAK